MSRILWSCLLLSAILLASGRLATADPPPEIPFNPLLGTEDVARDTATAHLSRIDPDAPAWEVGDPQTNADLRDAQLAPFIEEGAPPPLVLPP